MLITARASNEMLGTRECSYNISFGMSLFITRLRFSYLRIFNSRRHFTARVLLLITTIDNIFHLRWGGSNIWGRAAACWCTGYHGARARSSAHQFYSISMIMYELMVCSMTVYAIGDMLACHVIYFSAGRRWFWCLCVKWPQPPFAFIISLAHFAQKYAHFLGNKMLHFISFHWSWKWLALPPNKWKCLF